MGHNLLREFFALLLLLGFTLPGCGVTTQDLRQELQDESRGNREKIEQAQKTYKSREYLGLTSKDSQNWNSTDWSLWMDTHGGR